jgi:dienelactone hydrolase
MRNIYTLLFVLISTFTLHAQEKKVIRHDDYAHWNTLTGSAVSDSGKWITWQVNPQNGDGTLFVESRDGRRKKSFERGTNPGFTPSEKHFIFQQKPKEQDRREAIKKDVAKDKRPKDKLFIVRISDFSADTIHELIDHKLSGHMDDVLAYRVNLPSKEKDGDKKEDKKQSSEKETKPGKKKKTPKELHPLFVRHFATNQIHELGICKDYEIAIEGGGVLYTSHNDSTETFSVRYFEPATGKDFLLRDEIQDIASMAISPKGTKVGIVFTADTLEKDLNTYWFEYYQVVPDARKAVKLLDTYKEFNGNRISPHAGLSFMENSQYLFLGVYPDRPIMVEDTSLIDEDKAYVDVWTPFDPELQPGQKNKAKDWEKKHTLVVFRLKDRKLFALPGDDFSRYHYDLKQEHNLILHERNRDYHSGQIWTFGRYNDYSIINLLTGKEISAGDSLAHRVSVSPQGKFAYWYDKENLAWYGYDIAANRKIRLGADIPYEMHDTETDIPNQFPPHGSAGFTGNDSTLWLYDAFDIWEVDPRGINPSVCITGGFGRNNNIMFRYLKPHPDDQYIGRKRFIHGVHRHNRTNMLCRFNDGIIDTVRYFQGSFSGFTRAKYSNVYTYRTGDFKNYPELILVGKTDRVLSNTNPQQKEYFWGDVEFVDYIAGKDTLRGLLYTPENKMGNKTPLLVYFYEKNADNIYRHSVPAPSRSIINFPFYLSRGYAIFVPDIVYTEGEPGAGAYRCIMTGVDTVLAQNEWIDSTRMALNGQSWGGYQSAWMITQTGRFKAAFAGAPVSNMTSAYGGIRWKSGNSRIMQYEEGQSRLGVPMHENLNVYLENSPLFFTRNIQTPLLIMHNDNDGAVPWYQGIELYMSMIRQRKEVWMLVYNNEEHNLTRWANRMDLSRRVAEFYDHHLMDTPMPDWMKYGVPVWKKGKVER